MDHPTSKAFAVLIFITVISIITCPFKAVLNVLIIISVKTKGAFHLSELTGQTIPVVMRISLLIKTIQPV